MDLVQLEGQLASASLTGKLTPTSRYRTSLHSAPKSFILAKASSRKFPFSTPDDTRGMGISLSRELYGWADVCSSVPLHSVHSCPWWDQSHDSRHYIHQGIRRIVLVLSGSPQLVQT